MLKCVLTFLSLKTWLIDWLIGWAMTCCFTCRWSTAPAVVNAFYSATKNQISTSSFCFSILISYNFFVGLNSPYVEYFVAMGNMVIFRSSYTLHAAGRLPAEQLHAPHHGLFAVYSSSLAACARQHRSPWTPSPSCYWWDYVQDPPKRAAGHYMMILSTIRQPGSNLGAPYGLWTKPWTLLNRFRTGHGTCIASLHHWGLALSDLCQCGQRQTMTHIIDDCPQTKFDGGWRLFTKLTTMPSIGLRPRRR